MKLVPEHINEAIKHLSGRDLAQELDNAKHLFDDIVDNTENKLYLVNKIDNLLDTIAKELIDEDWVDLVRENGYSTSPIGGSHNVNAYISDKIISEIDKDVLKNSVKKVIDEILNKMFIPKNETSS